jgi:hypothetical protein
MSDFLLGLCGAWVLIELRVRGRRYIARVW